MKIVYILPYDWGAMPQYTAQIANSVSASEEVYVIGSKSIEDKHFSKDIKIIKVFDSLKFSPESIKKAFSFSNLKCVLSFRNIKIISEINPDVIHLTTPLIPHLTLFLLLFGYDKKYPLVYTKHAIFSSPSFKMKILNNIIFKVEKLVKIKKIVVHTENDRKLLAEIRKKNSEQIIVIPQGIYSFFKNNKFSYPVENNSILFFGRISSYKGLEYLLDSIPLICKEIPDLKVTIAGEGNLSPYSHLIRQNESRIKIYNEFVSDEKVSELFQKAEVVVLPYSTMSGQSAVLNVAFAFKKPVIASDVGGVREVIENGINGMLIPPKDYKALASAVIKLLTNKELQKRMEENICHMTQNISWEKNAIRHISLYKDLSETCIVGGR